MNANKPENATLIATFPSGLTKSFPAIWKTDKVESPGLQDIFQDAKFVEQGTPNLEVARNDNPFIRSKTSFNPLENSLQSIAPFETCSPQAELPKGVAIEIEDSKGSFVVPFQAPNGDWFGGITATKTAGQTLDWEPEKLAFRIFPFDHDAILKKQAAAKSQEIKNPILPSQTKPNLPSQTNAVLSIQFATRTLEFDVDWNRYEIEGQATERLFQSDEFKEDWKLTKGTPDMDIHLKANPLIKSRVQFDSVSGELMASRPLPRQNIPRPLTPETDPFLSKTQATKINEAAKKLNTGTIG